MNGGLKVGMRNNMPVLSRPNESGNQQPGNHDIRLQQGMQRLPVRGDKCPSCSTDHLAWYHAKYVDGDRCICTNCGYDVTVSEDLKRGEVIVK